MVKGLTVTAAAAAVLGGAVAILVTPDIPPKGFNTFDSYPGLNETEVSDRSFTDSCTFWANESREAARWAVRSWACVVSGVCDRIGWVCSDSVCALI